MATQTANNITLSLETVLKQNGLVILPLREYEELRQRAVPTYQLYGKEAEELDSLVKEGLKEYKAGKCIKAESLDEALRIYERRKNKKH